MLNVRDFFKQSSIYAISTFLSRAISLLLVPVYTKVLSPSDYGTIDIITVTCNLINLTIALEIHQAVARFYNDWHPEIRNNYMSTALYFSLGIYTIFVFLMLPFQHTLAGYFLEDTSKTKEILAALAMAWTSGIYYFTQSQLRWQMLVWNHVIVTVSFTVTTALFTIYMVVVKSLGVAGVLLGLTAGNIAGILLAIYFTRSSYGLYFKAKQLREMLKFSTPLVLSGISVFLSLYVDRIMIKSYLSLTDLGLFSIGAKFASIVGLLIVGVNNSLAPLIYKHYKDPNTPRQIEKIMTAYIFLGLLVFMTLSFFAREILIIFTTADYTGAQYVIPFLIVSTLLSALYNFTPGIFIKNKTRLIFYINLATAGINIALNFLLIHPLGIIGSCIATMAGSLINFLIYLYFNNKYYPIHFQWGKIVATTVSATAVVALVNTLEISNNLLGYTVKISAILLYMAFLLAYFYKIPLKKNNTN